MVKPKPAKYYKGLGRVVGVSHLVCMTVSSLKEDLEEPLYVRDRSGNILAVLMSYRQYTDMTEKIKYLQKQVDSDTNYNKILSIVRANVEKVIEDGGLKQ